MDVHKKRCQACLKDQDGHLIEELSFQGTLNLKKMDTSILKGMQTNHDYVRPHMALEGQTPAEATVIQI
jgi:hypothetical protein